MGNKYFLISKTLNTPFQKYKGNAARLTSNIPYTVDEIIVGIKGQKACRKITTFKDSQGKLIERAFDYKGKAYKNRTYQHKDYIIGEEEFVNSTIIKEYSLPRCIMSVYKSFKDQFQQLGIKTTLWNKNKVQTNYVAENINNGNKILSKVEVKAKPNQNFETHTFTEYPEIINNKLTKSENKFLSFKVDKSNNQYIEGSEKHKNVDFPQNDKYLGFRALEINDMKEPITRHFISKRGLDNSDFNINTNYIGDEHLKAFYLNGMICFNKLFKMNSKDKLVSTSRHEVEHGWQHFLDARNTGGIDYFYKYIAIKYGPIRNTKLQKEADKCTTSIKNYVPYTVNYKAYKRNYIEIMADKRGKEARNEYSKQGNTIRNNFKHIPEEML